MRLSIVIPVLNEAANIEATLAPLQALRTRGHEVIVVDGGSHDGTLLRTDGLIDRAIASQGGRARQLNAGLSIASGDVVLFLHADTILPKYAEDRIEGVFASTNCI